MTYSQIILNKGKEFSLLRFHPWVFSGAIAKKDQYLKDGDIVEVYSNKLEFLGMGYYAGGSIAVRIISFEKTIIDENFWFEKINKAYQYRIQLNILNENTNVCRLFFGEGDGAPGLILDYYDGHVVFQAHSWGVYIQKENISNAIIRVLGSELKSIYDKSSETISKHFTEKTKNGFLFGSIETEDVLVKENNHVFKIDEAQKYIFERKSPNFSFIKKFKLLKRKIIIFLSDQTHRTNKTILLFKNIFKFYQIGINVLLTRISAKTSIPAFILIIALIN